MSSSTNAIFLSGNDEEEKDEELFGEDNEDVNMLDTNVPSKTTETTGVANTITTSQSIFSTVKDGGDVEDEDNEGGGFEDDDADDDLFMTTTTTSITTTAGGAGTSNDAFGSSHHRHPDALLDNLFSPAFRNNPYLQSTSDRFRSALARVEEYPKSDVNAWKIVLTEIHQAYPKFLRENFSPENELKLDFMECVYGYLLRNFPYNSVHTQQILEILYQMSSLLSDEVSFIGSNNFSQTLTPRQIKAQRKMDHLFQKTLGVTFDYIENLEDTETGGDSGVSQSKNKQSTKNQLPDFTMNPTDGMLVSNVDLWLLYIQKCTRDAERVAKNPSMNNNNNMNGTSDKQMKLRQLALNDKSKFIRNCISRAYEQTLEMAHSIPNCHLLWRNYLNFVKSWPVQDQPALQNEQLQLTRKIYQSLISIPMAGLDDFWREYEQFERNWSDQLAQVLLAEHLPKYQHARGVYIERARYVSQISIKVNFEENKNSQYPLFRWSTPPINQAQEYNSDSTETLDSELLILGNYKARCVYERTNPERKLSDEQNAPMVRQAYKEMICAFMRHPEAWHEWAMWELLGNPSFAIPLDVGNNNNNNSNSKANKKPKKSKIGTNVKNCLQVFELARTQIPDCALLAISQAEVMELHGKNPKVALIMLEEFVKHRPCALGYVMLQKLVRRYRGMEEARKIFSRARRYLKEDHSQRKDLLDEKEKEKDRVEVKSAQQRSIVKTLSLSSETGTTITATKKKGGASENNVSSNNGTNNNTDRVNGHSPKTGTMTWHVFASHAQMEHRLNSLPKVASRIYDLGLRKHHSFLATPAYVLAYSKVLWELREYENLRSLLTRAIAACGSEREQETRPLWDNMLQLECLKGTNLETIRKVESSRRRALYENPDVNGFDNMNGDGNNESLKTLMETLTRTDGYDNVSMIGNGLGRILDRFELTGVFGDGRSNGGSLPHPISSDSDEENIWLTGGGISDTSFTQRLHHQHNQFYLKNLNLSSLPYNNNVGGTGVQNSDLMMNNVNMSQADRSRAARERMLQNQNNAGGMMNSTASSSAFMVNCPEWLKPLFLLLPPVTIRTQSKNPQLIEATLLFLKSTPLPPKPVGDAPQKKKNKRKRGGYVSSDDEDDDGMGNGGYGNTFRQRQRARQLHTLVGTVGRVEENGAN